jgi:(2Fe-2S) ferredoxin
MKRNRACLARCSQEPLMAIEGVLHRGFATEKADKVINMARTGLVMADELRPRMLRGRDDAGGRVALRPRPLRRGVPRKPAAVGPDDHLGHAVQQDGAGFAQGLRPDGRAALDDLDGLVLERRRPLPLLLFGRASREVHSAPRNASRPLARQALRKLIPGRNWSGVPMGIRT